MNNSNANAARECLQEEMLIVPRPAAPLGMSSTGWDEARLKEMADADPRWVWTDPKPWPTSEDAGALMQAVYDAINIGKGHASGQDEPGGPKLGQEMAMALNLAAGLFVGQLLNGSLDADPLKALALASLIIAREPPIALRMPLKTALSIEGWTSMSEADRFEAAAKALGIDAEHMIEKARLPLASDEEVHRAGLESLAAARVGEMRARETSRALERAVKNARPSLSRKGL